MALEKIILLKLQRSEFAGPVNKQQRSELNAADGPIYSLFETAKHQLNKSASKRFGFFDDNAEHKQLIGLLTNWQSETLDLPAMANKAAEQLQIQLELAETPFTATLLFAQESLLGQNYFYLLWLPTSEIIQVGGELEPYVSESIEPTKLQFALRLHIDEWQSSGSPKYLTQLLNRGSKDLAEAFERFSSFTEGLDLKQQTAEFIDIIESYSADMPEEDSKQFKTQVLDYCVDQDKVGNPVKVDELSEAIDQEAPQKFAEFVVKHQEQPEKEIYTDRSSLKKYMRFSGRDNSLSISFNAERFGSDITYEPASGTLSISQLPKSLRTQLSGYADKKA
ncbi:Nucleoid-associated protein YejK [BD1-7 clade bacterium]|uniref:Nucleoid-associated protein YejK n=1 Tax=BD1-7 clade bacterium TaxID=2029982 RepID=A0A5S9MPM6_9GAMM|nr:Nucleoid-associated protein YejK [BD1-7 clade bacterium]CAA0084955.1 Nucleoid-associated protein YejK [BD1-7 clade bacterium]CAA0114865.1 Nucleoid-associated protein YejK [BD1-7 clade bacterium]